MTEVSQLMEVFLASSTFNLFALIGPPGIGKTEIVAKRLRELDQPFTLISGYTTPLAFYNQLADCEKVVVIDDCAGLLENTLVVSLLNSACWPSSNGKREPKWSSSSGQVVCDSIDFESKIILVANVARRSPGVEALLSRAMQMEISLKPKDRALLLLKAASDPTYYADIALATEVATFLGERVKIQGGNDISLRTLQAGVEIATRFPDSWRPILLRTLPELTPQQVLRRLLQDGETTKKAAFKFCQETGQSQRTFYNLLKQERC